MGRLIYIPAPGGIAYTYTKSLDLDGVNEYVTVPHNSALTFDSVPFSISAWVKRDVSGTANIICSKRSGAGNNPGLELRIDNGDRVRFIISDGTGGSLNVYSSETIALNTWTLVTVSTDGATAAGTQLYMGATALTMNTALDTLSSSWANTSPMDIGRRGYSPDFYWDGKIFALAPYNIALSGAQVSELNSLSPKNFSAASTAGNIVGYWRFGNDPLDDATGGTGVIKDRVGGFDGTPMNTESGDIITDAP